MSLSTTRWTTGAEMADIPQSYQQLDPIGGYSTRPVTWLLSVGIFLYAFVATMWSWQDVSTPALAAAALVACGVGATGAVFWASSRRAPFSRQGYVVTVSLGVASMILISLSTWGSASMIGWGPILVGLVIVQLAPYRPPHELLVATILSAIASALLLVIRPGIAVPSTPELIVIVESLVPLLALGLGSRAYALALVRMPEAVSAGAASTEASDGAELHADITRSVQHDRVTILNRTVVPFLTDLLASDAVTAEDRDRAGVIADSIRSLMIADVDRSWLDGVIDDAHWVTGNSPSLGSEVVQDDDHIAGSMTTRQRTIVRALLVALFAHPGFDADGFGILLLREGETCVLNLRAKLDREESLLRSGLGVYFAVLRTVFPDFLMTFDPPTLTLRFSYDHK